MSEHEERLRAILPTADEATLNAALKAADARGWARCREQAETTINDLWEASAFDERPTLVDMLEAIRAMQDDGGGADSRMCACGHPMGGHDGRGCFAHHWVALNQWARCECKVSNPANGMGEAP